MHTVPREGVEEDRQRRHQRLTLTRSHLGDLATVQYRPPEELYIVVHHVPGDLVAPSDPVVLIDGRVALDTDEVVRHTELAVEVCSRYAQLGSLRKAAPRALDDGEGLGMDLVEDELQLVEDLLLELVYLAPDLLAGIEVLALDAGLEGLYLGTLAGDIVLDALAKGCRACTQLIVAEGVDLGVNSFDTLHPRGDLLEVTL